MGRNTKVGCNRCTCVAGQLYMCTGIICPITKHLKNKPNKALRAARSECVDGTSYMDDKGCNRCYCIDNTEYCTLHDCGSHGEKRPKLKSDFQCVNGTSFMDDEGCNRCFCINNHAVCTLNTCLKISDKDKALLRATRSECVEGTSYMDDEGCNRCHCIDNTAYCTLQDCGTHGGKTLRIKTDVKCVNGTSYMDDEGCNRCFCIDNNEVCTLKACIEETAFCLVGSVKQSMCGECVCTTGRWDCPSCQYNELFTKIHKNKLRFQNPECDDHPEGDWFLDEDECNYCTCINNNKVCTKMGCFKAEEIDEDKAFVRTTRSECVDGTSYMDDKGCNRCYCIDNTEYCTLHDCGSHGEKMRKIKSDFQCVNGTSFMDDEGCNRCFCINNRAFCTLKTCLKISDKGKALLRATRSECVEGTSYMDDEGCNRCHCVDNTEYCTLHDCGTHGGKTLRIKTDVKCVNGTSYMDDEGCNRCFCIDNNEVCTLKACIEESAFCVVGSVKQSTCGECVCTTGIWDCPSCENNVLFNKILNTRSSPRCYTGSSKMVDCGECFCVSGKWICPICDEIHPRLDMSMTRRGDRRCVHGERYKTDPCNYCVCVDGHDICTNTDCAAVKLDGVLCNPYKDISPKKVDCNVCTCSKSTNLKIFRWLWYCTKRDCDTYEKNTKLRKPNIMSTPCREGSTRQIDNCNHCKCEYGLFVCTNEICDTESTTPGYYVLRRKKECDVFDSKRIKCNRCTCIFGKWSCTHFKCKKKLNDNIEYISWEDDTPPEFVEMTEAEDHGQPPVSNETFYSDWLSSPKHPTKHPSANDRYKHNNKKGNRLRHKHHRGHKHGKFKVIS
ncbi:cysteine-rich motor neuron 1 protein-like [Spodoptera litura]|uniref:Cysteine-rich motor neuron 1 protein-like n=1 Tax=Spodoptera litura TaxID=69820 RepID=A0A9J7EU88_SPOLT|nr:cysteine-rich motor neuron 1 protein-like [Spodoptera litura]